MKKTDFHYDLPKRLIAFYPKKTSSTGLRWQTINEFKKRLDITDIGDNKNKISINEKKLLLDLQTFIYS